MSYLGFEMFHDMFTRGEISCPGELSLTTIFPSKKIHNKASSQQVKFVMIRIEFIFSRFKSILLGASGEGFRKQTKEGKSLFTLRGLVSCDANKTSSELPLLLMVWRKRYVDISYGRFLFFSSFSKDFGLILNKYRNY